MRHLWFLVSIFIAVFAFSWAYASDRNLYQDAVSEVIDQSAAARKEAASGALARVIIRVAGVDRALQAPAVKEALSKPDSYIQGFSYTVADEGFGLSLQFDRSAVDKLLRRAGLPKWPLPRPAPLVWVALDDGAGQEVVRLANLDIDQDSVQQQLVSEGFDFRYPILDLEDRIAMGVSSIWYGDRRAIMSASERYSANYVLVGKFAKVSTGYIGSWSLFTPTTSRSLDVSSDSLDQAIASGISFTRNLVAEQTAINVAGTSVSGMQLVVSGVLSFSDYTAAIDYVSGLTGVSDARLLKVDGDRLIFDIKLAGRLDRVESLITAQGKMKKLPADSFSLDQQQLQYYWIAKGMR